MSKDAPMEITFFATVKSFDANIPIIGNFVLHTKNSIADTDFWQVIIITFVKLISLYIYFRGLDIWVFRYYRWKLRS